MSTRLQSFRLQAALYELFSNDEKLKKLVIGCYDYVPVSPSFPFIEFRKLIFETYSTKTDQGEKTSIELAVWSTYSGKKECADILAQVVESLETFDFEMNVSYEIRGGEIEQIDAEVQCGTLILDFITDWEEF